MCRNRTSHKQRSLRLSKIVRIIEAGIKAAKREACMKIKAYRREIHVLCFQPQAACARLTGEAFHSVYQLRSQATPPVFGSHIQVPDDRSPVPGDVLHGYKPHSLPLDLRNHGIIPICSCLSIAAVQSVTLAERGLTSSSSKRNVNPS